MRGSSLEGRKDLERIEVLLKKCPQAGEVGEVGAAAGSILRLEGPEEKAEQQFVHCSYREQLTKGNHSISSQLETGSFGES